MRDGWKEFTWSRTGRREIARHEGESLGYNGQSPGPTIEAVRAIACASSSQSAAEAHDHPLARHHTALRHWMAWAASRSRRSRPAKTWVYEFLLTKSARSCTTARRQMTQMAMGMMGMFVVHREGSAPASRDRDFCFLIHALGIDPGSFARG